MPGPNLTIISNQHAQEVNSTSPWLLLLHLNIPANGIRPEVHFYVAHNDEDVVYNNITYKAFQFDFPDFDAKPGELPQFALRVTNIDKSAHKLFEQYQGAVGGIATFSVISARDTLSASPAQELTYEILSASAKDDWATITMGGENPMRRRFPTLDYSQNHCQWTYNSPIRQATLDAAGAACAYQGNSPTCDYTLEGINGCVAHLNQHRFGACPGIDTQGFRLASIT